MFYDRLLKICKEYGVKPTPVLKELGISPGNLKRWENGASVNSETLTSIANYFKVICPLCQDTKRKKYRDGVRIVISTNITEIKC